MNRDSKDVSGPPQGGQDNLDPEVPDGSVEGHGIEEEDYSKPQVIAKKKSPRAASNASL
jgi:hypothetical protein